MALEMNPGLPAGWVKKLYLALKETWQKRELEIRSLVDVVAGEDPRELAKRYIEPNVQVLNPADLDDDLPLTSSGVAPFKDWLSRFLQKPHLKKDGRHVLFLLADAGMGKTSALVMLRLSEITNLWPAQMRFQLFKLNEDTLGAVRQIEEPGKTVLLLDALDEDSLTFKVDVQQRIRSILDATKAFRQVVITCRTQFFPRLSSMSPLMTARRLEEEVPELGIVKRRQTVRDSQGRIFEWGSRELEERGLLNLGGYLCQVLYLSPFDDRQVMDYLEQIYTPGGRQFQKAWELVESMDSLRMRPLLLSYVEDLIDGNLKSSDSLRIYDHLVGS